MRSEGIPAVVAVAAREIEPGLVDRDSVYGRDPVRAALVIAEVGLERLLDVDRLDPNGAGGSEWLI
jgi:hypothetical protein